MDVQSISYNELPKYQKKFGLPIRVIPKLQNAFYIPHSTEDQPKPPTNGNTLIKDILYAKDILRKRKTGGIIIGDTFLNPTILAHEKGHQMDSSWLGNNASKLEKFWGTYHIPIVGSLGAELLGLAVPGLRNYARATNLGIQALSAVPKLYSEYKASQNAKKIFPKSDVKLLNKMYTMYIRKALMDRLVVPALIHAGVAGATSVIE